MPFILFIFLLVAMSVNLVFLWSLSLDHQDNDNDIKDVSAHGVLPAFKKNDSICP